MKWVTRQNAHVDRIACPWLIKRFVDRDAKFLFVEPGRAIEVAEEQRAIPFDVPSVELTHHSDKCSFDAIIEKYAIKDSALLELAKIVRGADTPNHRLTPQSEGLLAIAEGFRRTTRTDHENMEKQFHVYDALYEFCKSIVK
jgi:hypothetical protein